MPVDSTLKAQVTTLKPNSLYELRIPSPKSGDDFVYRVRAIKKGDFCNLAPNIVPVSCPAVIADQVGMRARKDGSSSGEPFVQLVSGNSYVSGIHDAESGDFIYRVSVETEGSSCKVASITAKK